MKKLKKAFSLSLALVLSLTMTVPAFAASTLTGNQLNPAGSWGNGPSLTLTGVVAERPTEMDFPVCYDVEVGGSLVMELPYPADKHRGYTIMVAGTYVSPDFKEYLDNGQSWDVPKESEGGYFDASSGKTKYVYRFTEADMGQLNGYQKVIYPMISWDEAKDPNADYADDSGHVYFGIRVVPAKPMAKASTQTVTVDGKKMEFQMYALLDENGNGTNYIKLRDMAQVLNGTKAQFSVGYDNASKSISVATGEAYTSTGTEMTTPFSGDRSYTGGTQSLQVNGKAVDMTAITLLDDAGGGYNYFKLRDLGKALGFNVGYSREKGVFIESDKPYSE